MAAAKIKGTAKQETSTRTGKKAKGRKGHHQITQGKIEAGGPELTDEIKLRNLEWQVERMEKGQVPIYTADIETDPFEKDRVPVPFLIGLFDGLNFWKFDSVEKFLHFVDDQLEPGIIYMHNGGRFDFFYMLEGFEGKTMIVGSRIVCAWRPGQHCSDKHKFDKYNRMEFRDSFAIMPFPLKSYKKDKLPIEWLARENRAAHMEEITSYLFGDCSYLWELCIGFQREFGDYKTIASAAFDQLTGFHKYDTLNKATDSDMRTRYYFGGRVQCFEKGVIEKPVTIYDVNSMYPYVMSDYLHPVSWPVLIDRTIRGWKPDGTPNREKLKTFFLTVQGTNKNAFPVRRKDGAVDFTEPEGVFHVTIHEYLAATSLGLFKLDHVIDTYNFLEYSKFHLFVDHFYKARKTVTAKLNEHKKTCTLGCQLPDPDYCPVGSDLHAHSLYYKYVLNSAYGKFGLNPENYFDWKITKVDKSTGEPERPEGDGWVLDMLAHGKFFVWKKPVGVSCSVKNIGTAASITGAARSILLRAIAKSKGVIYCDTDSIICEEFGPDAGTIDEKQLGAWKAEGTGALTGIAGKKLYVVFDENGVCVKHACKGVALEPEDILRVAGGEEILTFRDAPTFQRDGSAKFIERKVRMT